MYNQFPGLLSFTNLVLSNTTNHTRTRWLQAEK